MLKVVCHLNPISLTDFSLWGKLSSNIQRKLSFTMRVILTTILSLFLLSLTTFGLSQERPETIVIPVSSMGEVSEVRKQILQNTLTDELKEHFRIVPQEKYEQVLEKVFQELEYEECSEDVCVMRIQEMLQVENVFHLQILG